jgi:putative FmdB family regulatory protein
MPTYDYRCRKCGHSFELFHGIKDDAPKRCPKCRGRAQRVPAGGAGVLFKGSGFYITDYRSKSYKEKAHSEKGGASPGAVGAGEKKKSGEKSGKSGSGD